jgi:hypothetical protein
MSDVLAQCREKYGDTPCVRITAKDGTILDSSDCTDWCPLLNKVIEEPDEGGVDGGHSG